MSVPTATFALKPKSRMRIGVIRDPPPMPVSPTRTPIKRPVSVNCQVMSDRSLVRVDQDLRYFRTRELLRRELAVGEEFADLRPREMDVLRCFMRARLRGRHRAARATPERMLEEHRLDVELMRLELVEDQLRVVRAVVVADT